MKEFLKFCYYKGEAMIRLFFAYKFLVITDNEGLHATRSGLTIGDTKEIVKYLNKLADTTITEIEGKSAIAQVNKILSSDK